jgi:prophage DNA circulation protein
MWGGFIDDLLSASGLVLTVVGFIITIYNVVKAKSASEAAREATRDVRSKIIQIDMVAEFSAALATMDEIKRLQRQKAWPILPDRYSELRRSLVSIKSANPDLPEHHKANLQSAIVSLSRIESQIEETLDSGEDPSNITKLNDIVSDQTDNLQTILTEVKIQVGA